MTETQPRLRDQRLPIVPFGFALSSFLAITYLLCLSLLLIVPNVGMHVPIFRLLPGFSVSVIGIATGLIESVAYGWYSALLFGWLYNFFASAQD